MQEVSRFYKKFFKPGIVCTDTRKIKPGEIFIALSGDNFNGNEFSRKALENGAKIAVVDDPVLKNERNHYYVDDALSFLQDLASFHRRNSNFHVIGLTGTNGKTTTKELIRTVLEKKYSCMSTEGNLNNHIGVPLTLLGIPSDIEFAVIEMGANHQGEINQLCEIAMPDSGLITNIGMAHLEGFGSFDGVIRAKSELYNYITAKHGKLYMNSADNILANMLISYDNKIKYNGLNSVCSGEYIESFPHLKVKITYHAKQTYVLNTNLYGEYNLTNIMAAACIGADLGVPYEDINAAVEEYIPVDNRSQIMQFGTTKLIMDCYNANPTSMKYALSSFSKLRSDKKLVILGSMKEMGKHSHEEHEKLVKLVENYKYKNCIFIGEEFDSFRNKSCIFLSSFDDLKNYLEPKDLSGYTILVKGSRANQLERVSELFASD